MCQRLVTYADVAAPIAKNATWPSEIWPAHPVSTTSETQASAKAITALALMT